MNKLIVGVCSLLATAALSQAQIAQWTFETSIPSTGGPVAPEIGSGSATGVHAGAATFSSPAGNGSSHSFSANTWAVGDYWQFQTSTLGYSGIKVSYDQTSSNTGPGQNYFQYSTDGNLFHTVGSTYSIVPNASPNPTWNGTTASTLYSFTYDLSSIAALDNASSVYFRIVNASTTSANGGTIAGTGTDRIDNFTVMVVPEPQSLALLGSFGLLAWTLRRRS